MATTWHRLARPGFFVSRLLTPQRAALLRTGLVAILVIAATVTITPAASADRAAEGEGSDGSFSVAIATAASDQYAVSVTALNSHPDVTTSSVEMEVTDDRGTRTFSNPYTGGQVRATLTFDNRGPCTVRITFRFTRTNGPEQSNAARPVTISYPSAPSATGSQPAPDSSQADAPGTAAERSVARCITPTGMNGLIDQDTSDSQRPWKRPAGSPVTINFAVDESITPEWRADLEYATAAWNKSPCLDTRIVDSCPSGSNCVSVSALDKMDADGNFDAVEKDGFTTGGKITLLNKLNKGQRRNVAVHEMGHAIGLVHRKTKHVLMEAPTYDDVFDPDATDYKNLLFSYDRMQRRP